MYVDGLCFYISIPFPPLVFEENLCLCTMHILSLFYFFEGGKKKETHHARFLSFNSISSHILRQPHNLCPKQIWLSDYLDLVTSEFLFRFSIFFPLRPLSMSICTVCNTWNGRLHSLFADLATPGPGWRLLGATKRGGGVKQGRETKVSLRIFFRRATACRANRI